MPTDKEQYLSGADLLDRMHLKARDGASLKIMMQRFKNVNPHMLAYWMRRNGYARNGMDYPKT